MTVDIERESRRHKRQVLPEGDWRAERGKNDDEELFVCGRKNGRRIARMWNGVVGRDAAAQLFAGSKELLEASEAVLEDVNADTLLRLRRAVNAARAPIPD